MSFIQKLKSLLNSVIDVIRITLAVFVGFVLFSVIIAFGIVGALVFTILSYILIALLVCLFVLIWPAFIVATVVFLMIEFSHFRRSESCQRKK